MRTFLIMAIVSLLIISGCAQISKQTDGFNQQNYCEKDEDCVLDTWEEKVCCDTGCKNYPINREEYNKRIEWRQNNCGENETNIFYEGVRNGSMKWDNAPSKWSPCFIEEDECGREGFFKEAYCSKGVCKGKK